MKLFKNVFGLLNILMSFFGAFADVTTLTILTLSITVR
jgi:hypothetical protein